MLACLYSLLMTDDAESEPCMDKILERYERYSYAEKVLISAEYETQGNWCHEYRKLKAKVETIQKCQKHLMGEDLETLNLKELQQLEQQLESSLKHIRTRKSQLMVESISALQRKEKSLQEENKVLQKEKALLLHAARGEAERPAAASATGPNSTADQFVFHVLHVKGSCPNNKCQHLPCGSRREGGGRGSSAAAGSRWTATMDA
ncbi:m4 protein isoform X4 [Zea mays]|uniref:m4 protein isoform X4 n=1 Tax=Zea mays TaxID=4577 RepID=UPI0009A98BAE|nr:m4 protein isoform X4 [Zea mays]|eukprot:XP_020395946.1 m4 protein isoform X3 [Zea mays]